MHRGRELPRFLNYSVFSKVFQEKVEVWRAPTEWLCKSVLLDMACTLANVWGAKRFHQFNTTLKMSFKDAMASMTKYLNDEVQSVFQEESIPSTQNHYFMDTVNKIRAKRLTEKFEAVFEEHETYSGKAIREYLHQYSLAVNQSNENQEIQDLTDLLTAYWKVAEKRFIDNIEKKVDKAVLKLHSLIQDKLSEMACMDNAQVQALFAVTSSEATERASAENRRSRVTDAIQKLETLI